MIIPKRYDDLSFSSSGNDATMTAGSSFKVTIQSWFSGSAHQYLNFKTSDSVLFNIERQSNQAVGVPYALTGAENTEFVRLYCMVLELVDKVIQLSNIWLVLITTTICMGIIMM